MTQMEVAGAAGVLYYGGERDARRTSRDGRTED